MICAAILLTVSFLPPLQAKPYKFGYGVKDAHQGLDFNQQEASDGHVVSGQYRVQLPDGRTQVSGARGVSGAQGVGSPTSMPAARWLPAGRAPHSSARAV